MRLGLRYLPGRKYLLVTATWTTYGLNVVSVPEVVRFQANWIVKRERPASAANELVAQVIVIF